MKYSSRFGLGLCLGLLFCLGTVSSTAQSIVGGCLYALDPTASQAFYISGNPTVSTACSIVVESSASNAFVMGGTNTLSLGNHAKVGVVGGWQLGSSTLLDTISNQHVQPVNITNPGDPLAGVQAPTQGTIVGTSHTSFSSNHPPANNTISPGVYCGGLAIGSTDKTGFTMGPGTYIMAGGGFSISSQAVVSGTGVSIYNTSSSGWGCSGSSSYTPISINGQASVKLSAPTSGSLAGILMFGNRTGCTTIGSCQDQISGQTASSLNGALYFKSDSLLYSGNSPNGTCLAAVADKITLNGNASFGSTGCAINPISVSVSPQAVSLYAGQTQQFTAAVTNSYNNGVTWSIAPSGEGSLNSTGLYTAPGSIAAQQTVTITATSQADTTKSGSATVTLLVPKVTPTITWATPAPITYGTSLSATQLNASSNVPGTFAYTPAAGTSLPVGTQTLSVTFTPTDTVDYTAATASVQLVVNKAAPSVTWSTPAPITYGTPLSATQLDATSSVAGGFVYSPLAGTVLQAGTQTLSVTFTPTDTVDYSAATASVQLVVNKATSPITWSTPAAITYGTPLSATQLDATSTVAGGFVYSPVAGTVLQAGTQTLSVTFTPDDAVDYTTATASVLLTVNSVAQCNTSGYGFVRTITIDHGKVAGSDQVGFPFLFSTTDPSFRSIANGGRVTSDNGFDIVFSSDPSGATKLDHELEQYNPTTGQVIAWVRIPLLSHTTDTVLYLFYGNPNITTSQQNPAGVWDSHFLDVLHLDESGTTVFDSTSNGNNGTKVLQNSPVEISAGQFGGTQSFNGTSDYISLPPTMTAGLSKFSVSFWTNTTDSRSNGTFWNRPQFVGDSTNGSPSGDFGIITNSGNLGIWSGLATNQDNSAVSSKLINDGKWHRIDAVNDGSEIRLYLDGADTGQSLASGLSLDSYGWYLGAQHYYAGGAAFFHQGSIDEFRFSNSARSADWIATEYNNQSTPSAFYSLNAESTLTVSPGSVALYAAGTQQFAATAIGNCSTAVSWSMSPAGLGTLTQDGLYTAPASVTAEQTVTITASSTSNPTMAGSAFVTLLPIANPTLTLSAPVQPPYVVGATQEFSATLTNQDGSPLVNIPVTFTVTGVNNSSGSGTTDSDGVATFSYSGTNPGNDTIQASRGQVPSNTVLATWIIPKAEIATTSVLGRFFFLNAGCCWFSAPPDATPLFEQFFPTINFDPASNAIPGNTTIGTGTHPFTDVTLDNNGNFSGTIVAQGNGYVAGSGSLTAFQASFTGSFIVQSGEDVDIPIYVDNGFILGIGGGATRVSGPIGGGAPSTTPFGQYPVVGAFSTSIGGATVRVHFPAAGTYPYELDYVEDGQGLQSLMMSASVPNNGLPAGIPPGGTLTLSPNSVQTQPVGGTQTFTVTATDAAGNPVSNLSVGLVVSLNNTQELGNVTDNNGVATFKYAGSMPGTDQVEAVALISGMVTYSNVVNVPWAQSSGGTSGTGTGTGTGATLSVSVSAPSTTVLPNTPLQLTGLASDSALPQGDTISLAWTQVSGPGTVTFSNPQQASTTASFSEGGSYQVQLTATDVNGTASAQITIAVPAALQGWIGSPLYGASVSGIVPITMTSGVSLNSGTLTIYPADNPGDLVLNKNVAGTGTIAQWDTTQVANGSYWITLQATNSSGASMYNLALVTVVGNYKPGRVTSTVTDLVVPAKGLAIKIQRTYDSLNAGKVGDFGHGWSLGITTDLTVDPKGNVTFTLGGQRRTFYLTPQILGWFLPYYVPVYAPEPGMHGTLVNAGSGCADFFDFLVPDGSLWACVGGGFFSPPGYVYTDPTGTAYTILAGGQLQSIVDKNGNALTISTGGITSSTVGGQPVLSVPFERDSNNRITSITYPPGNQYTYSYDSDGNLASVTYPTIATASTYTYDSNHLYLSGTDFRGNLLPSTAYYDSNTDGGNSALDGRLLSVTTSDGAGATYTTSYAYTLSLATCPATPNNNLVTGSTTVTYPDTGTATLNYNCAGDVVSSTDANHLTTTNVYDANRNLVSVTAPAGDVTSYIYDSNGNRTSVTYQNPGSPTVTNTKSSTAYNAFSEPTQTVDELNNVRTFNYDVNFNPQSVTDSVGTLASFVFGNDGTMQSGAIGFDISANPSMASQFVYDVNGNLICRTDALGHATSYSYDSLGHKISMTVPQQGVGCLAPGATNAGTTIYTNDDFGNVTQTSAPLGRTTKSEYDANGNKTQDTDADGNITKYKYDALNRLTLTTYADLTTDQRSYDFRGNLAQEIDQSGNTTKYVYDPGGRLKSFTRAFGTSNATTTSYDYDNDGRKLSQTTGAATTNYTYDAAGNLTGVSGAGGTFTYAYDNARNRISATDGKGNVTSYQYDPRKRLVETDYPDHTKKTNTYDGPGNLASVTDQNSKEVQYAYDAANQLQSVTQTNSPNAPNNVTSYGYDALGDITGLTDANSHLTESNFDLLSEKKSTTLPDGSLIEQRTYDPAGNLQTLLHFNGKTTTYSYDPLNRLLSRSTSGESTDAVTFVYTATGKRHKMFDASGETDYTYDSMDRLTQKTTPAGTLDYTYDGAGNLASMKSADGAVNVAYTWDNLNRLQTVVDSQLGTTTYTYDNANNVATVAYPNGVTTTLTYDELNRVKTLGSQVASYAYMRDLTGKITDVGESTSTSNRSVTWSFDDINRLTREQIADAPNSENGTVSYGLDAVGNRASATSSISALSPVSGSYNLDDQLQSETYDQNGNVTRIANGNTFVYDSENHLISMGGTVALQYDGDGYRVAKTASSGTTRYLVDDLNPTGYPQVVEELVNGAIARTYTYGLQRISQYQFVSNTWTASFYSYDGGGNVRQLMSSSGAVTDTYDYDAFGNKINSTGTTPNNYLYRSEQFDTDLGLYYLRARYYNPTTGRFMSRDPEDGRLKYPATLHKYLYVGGDPVNWIDPRGREELEEYIKGGANRLFIFTQYYVPTYIGNLQFYGTLAAGLSTAIGWWCEVTDECGQQPVDPGPGPFEPEGPPPVAPGGAGAQH